MPFVETRTTTSYDPQGRYQTVQTQSTPSSPMSFTGSSADDALPPWAKYATAVGSTNSDGTPFTGKPPTTTSTQKKGVFRRLRDAFIGQTDRTPAPTLEATERAALESKVSLKKYAQTSQEMYEQGQKDAMSKFLSMLNDPQFTAGLDSFTQSAPSTTSSTPAPSTFDGSTVNAPTTPDSCYVPVYPVSSQPSSQSTQPAPSSAPSSAPPPISFSAPPPTSTPGSTSGPPRSNEPRRTSGGRSQPGTAKVSHLPTADGREATEVEFEVRTPSSDGKPFTVVYEYEKAGNTPGKMSVLMITTYRGTPGVNRVHVNGGPTISPTSQTAQTEQIAPSTTTPPTSTGPTQRQIPTWKPRGVPWHVAYLTSDTECRPENPTKQYWSKHTANTVNPTETFYSRLKTLAKSGQETSTSLAGWIRDPAHINDRTTWMEASRLAMQNKYDFEGYPVDQSGDIDGKTALTAMCSLVSNLTDMDHPGADIRRHVDDFARYLKLQELTPETRARRARMPVFPPFSGVGVVSTDQTPPVWATNVSSAPSQPAPASHEPRQSENTTTVPWQPGNTSFTPASTAKGLPTDDPVGKFWAKKAIEGLPDDIKSTLKDVNCRLRDGNSLDNWTLSVIDPPHTATYTGNQLLGGQWKKRELEKLIKSEAERRGLSDSQAKQYDPVMRNAYTRYTDRILSVPDDREFEEEWGARRDLEEELRGLPTSSKSTSPQTGGEGIMSTLNTVSKIASDARMAANVVQNAYRTMKVLGVI